MAAGPEQYYTKNPAHRHRPPYHVYVPAGLGQWWACRQWRSGMDGSHVSDHYANPRIHPTVAKPIRGHQP